MQLLHGSAKTSVSFDDEHLVSSAGLVPVMRLGERCGLSGLVRQHVSLDDAGGANPHFKVCSIVAGMVAGADSIDDLDVIRHGGMDRLFTELRAPSTLGSFLRAFTWGHVRQLEKVNRQVLARLARHAPLRGLNVLATTISTPLAAPVIAATRLRGGTAASARGAASHVAETITTARDAGCTGTLIVRGDSAYYSGAVIAACRRAGAHFSFTVSMAPKIKRTIAAIPPHTWTPIKYPRAILDADTGRWISDAEVAEVPYTAFASKKNH